MIEATKLISSCGLADMDLNELISGFCMSLYVGVAHKKVAPAPWHVHYIVFHLDCYV